ncbi:MAG: hypothetical protein WC682_00685 [Parcubacteria group bacterium]|jgi:hypothetical protein
MSKKWEVQKIFTLRSGELVKTLPKGLTGKAEGKYLIIKVPRYPHKLNGVYMDWCRSVGITNGFSL